MGALFRSTAIAVAGLILASGADAQEFRPCPNQQASWQLNFEHRWASWYALSAQDAKAFADTLRNIAEVLHTTKVVNPPMGFDVKTLARPNPSSGCGHHPCRTGPVTGNLWSVFYLMGDMGKGCKQFWDSEIAIHVDFDFNNLESSMGRERGLMEDLDGRWIYLLPQKVGEVQGFPYYEYEWLVVTNNARPYWVPVSQEQFLRLLIRNQEADMARVQNETAARIRELVEGKEKRRKDAEESARAVYESEKEFDPKHAERARDESWKAYEEIERQNEEAAKEMPAQLKKTIENMQKDLGELRDKLASLSPEERKAQAWFGTTPGSLKGLVPPNTPDAEPLIKLNPDFFDPSLPRTALQLMTVYFAWVGTLTQGERVSSLRWEESLGSGTDRPMWDYGSVRVYEFLQTADWRKVASLLAPRRAP